MLVLICPVRLKGTNCFLAKKRNSEASKKDTKHVFLPN